MKVSLQNFDLNLLLIFNALMVEKNVSKAADMVFLSQSAMSHALNRLRSLLDDPILVRTDKGMVPTPRALAMEVPIREALTNLQLTLYSPDPFDPSISCKSFVIYGPEYFESVYLPVLAARLQKIAPHIEILSGILTDKNPEAGLTSGEVDFVVGIESITEVPGRLRSIPWIQDDITCVVRKENPKIGRQISLKEFMDVRHIHYSTLGTPYKKTFMDQWIEENNINRKIAVSTPGYLGAAMITAETDYVLTVPRKLANKLIKTRELRIVDSPENFPEYRLNLIWHPLYEKDPAHMWFRGKLLELAG